MSRSAEDAAPNGILPKRPYARDADDVLAALGADPDGLAADEAAERLERFGPNRLAEPRKRSAVLRFLSHFNNILIYVLLGAAVITAALTHFVDTAVILAVVIVNAVIGFIQEGRAERAMESIRGMLAPHASVLRDGERRALDAAELVPGDILLLEAGDRVPADVRLFRARGLQAREAILTGESMPVEKSTRPVSSDAGLGDRSCMAFSGTLITAGHGRGVVVATGENSQVGRIGGMVSGVKKLTTPLLRQIDEFTRWLSILILVAAAIILITGYALERLEFWEMFMVVVSLSVAAIPEGLPAILTITLAIGVQAMARRNAIVRRLPAIETLGAVSVICSDKTGTLTRNEMMVAAAATSGHEFTVQGNGYEPEGAIELDGRSVNGREFANLEELARAGALCNNASLRHHDGQWTVQGDPMEGALLVLARKVRPDGGASLSGWTRTDAIPFDSQHRFMATLHHDHEGNAFIYVKGAPERILEMCAEQRTPSGEMEPLDPDFWRQRAEQIAAEGQRVLAFAVRPVKPRHTVLEFDDVESGLVLIGLVGIIDPPRPEAIEAVAECHRAGIRVKMITGDHAGTAVAIGRKVGLQHPDQVLTGADLEGMDDQQLATAVLETDIFARTSPEHKLRLVKGLQSHGLTVAMTGDGVNDAAALKRADAGIAMGITGSEAAREASELVLADDNFASIAAAVREGRTVYDNIKKVLAWTLPTNGGEAATILVALLAGMALPITPLQILWVNLVTAVTLGIALAFEPTEEGTMRRPPRPRDEALLTGELVWRIILVSVLFLGGVFGVFVFARHSQGYPVELARTIAMNTLVVMEIFNLFFVRNIYGTSLTWKAVRGTPVVWATVSIVVIAQFAITYLPFMQNIFDTRDVALQDGLIIIGIGVALFAVIEIEKQARLSVTGGRGAGHWRRQAS